MRLQQLIQSLKKGIYAWAFWIPFAFVFTWSGSPFCRSDNLLLATIQWFVLGSILGTLSGITTVTVVWAALKLAKLSRIKSTVFATSTVLCLGGFAGGATFHFLPEWPDTTHYKLLMPHAYKVHLKEGSYTLWYYPDWTRADQNRFPLMEHTERLSRMQFPSPFTSIKASDGSEVYLTNSKHSGGGGCRIYKRMIGEIEIKKTGEYTVGASLEDRKERFVLAIVPFTAYDPNIIQHGPSISYFTGEEDTSNLISPESTTMGATIAKEERAR